MECGLSTGSRGESVSPRSVFMSEVVPDEVFAASGLSGRQPLVAIIGGGISGLAAAHRVGELEPSARVQVLESGARTGGVLGTVRKDGFLIEESADSFLTAMPHGLDLCRRLGLENEIIPTNPDRRRAFVVSRGRLEPIPDGLMIMAPTRLWPMLTTPILGPWDKLRMGLELLVPRRDPADESLASFARRRFGSGAARAVDPAPGRGHVYRRPRAAERACDDAAVSRDGAFARQPDPGLIACSGQERPVRQRRTLWSLRRLA